jgi:hypothetical protein
MQYTTFKLDIGSGDIGRVANARVDPQGTSLITLQATTAKGRGEHNVCLPTKVGERRWLLQGGLSDCTTLDSEVATLQSLWENVVGEDSSKSLGWDTMNALRAELSNKGGQSRVRGRQYCSPRRGDSLNKVRVLRDKLDKG